MSRPKRSEKVRVPLGARNRLSFRDLDKDFVYRVINDEDDRLIRAQDAGYEFVTSDEKLGDERVAEGTVPGSHVAKPVGNGVTGYLMRIPKEYYEEDQARKAKIVNESEEAMKPERKEGFTHETYGDGLKTT